ncbi:isoprenylcysteine carboxyl methyltransferase family protein [Meiothermus sp.]|uniref:isoprenylcysteine carboxyl methyltransferase family protein n=1 Tax=Meiothermus sp. TaxID=1955249 RepID=UPI0021DD7EFA|nr:isoprenylcysteine carboxylmethyltransferase family protein [Meiothermus sp.]GIW35414.1 MAG: isoprenylcysteine carboxyl methyltransferase [Meiothermus sp.]
MVAVWVALAFVALQRLLELRLAQANLRWALSQGGQEYGREHYPLFFLLHIGWMLGWLLEGLAGNRLSPLWWLWLTVFVLAQGLRYWAIRSLGRYWNTRIVIVPGAQRIEAGPYRYLRHPNYLAVALELLSLPLVFNAWITALVASLLNAMLLLLVRIPTEERALKAYSNALNPEQSKA